MEVEGKIECRGRNTAPIAEVDTVGVLAHHPAEIHIESLAGGPLLNRGEVFLAALWVGRSEEEGAEIGHHPTHIATLLIGALEPLTEGAVEGADVAYGPHKAVEVGTIEGAVDIALEELEFTFRGPHHKLIGTPVEVVHHSVCTLNNGLAIAPGNGCGQESAHLAVELRGE